MLIDRRQLLGVMLTGFMASGAGADVPQGRLFVSCRRDAAENASVACFDRDGREVFATSLPARGDGVVAFGGQYQGAAEDAPPLIGLLRPGGTPAMLAVQGDALFAMNNYIGSVAFDDDGGSLIATSPEGGAALIWDMAGDRLAASLRLPDVCGAAANGRQSFIVTSGNAGIATLGLTGLAGPGVEQRWIWDNHARVLREAGQADG